MTDEEKLAKAMSIVEVAVQEMAELDIGPIQRAIGLAWHMNAQVEMAMPTKDTADRFKAGLIA
jgi:hypothetical protein